MAVDFPEFAQSDSLNRWLESSTGQRYATSFDEALSIDYETHRDAQFGDTEAFARICEAAAEGPPYLQRRVADTVPGGYRIQALNSSDRARRAILLLEDPNGIGALQRAALRSSDDLAEEIEEHVEILTAHMNLIGGGNRNIPSWGDTGFAPGGIQSFGEPVPIEINQLAEVYLADTGNNRIQRFNPDGRPDRQWGPSADIANAWFTDSRSWYASGSAAGTDSGEWWNPTDIVLIEGTDGDGFAALDARGHIQIFDHQGRAMISWRVETRNEAEAGVGGESYLAWIPRQQLLFAFIQNEAVGYTLASEEIHRWEIEDGIPNAVEINRRGEILMAFGSEVIRYDVGGFRHGTVIGEDVLGIGFEDMDITLDEEDRLWIFTDNGWVYKFRRNGRLDWKIEAYTNPTSNPRIAVQEEILFLSHFDRIEQIDVRQLRMNQEDEQDAGNSE